VDGQRRPAIYPLHLGSTGKPKGVLHTTGGYLLQAAMSMKYVFDYREGETYWCTADVGWVTGHTYIVYGPARHRRPER
jgi:acetyl-CoA synthetase